MALEAFGTDVATFPDLDVTGNAISDTRSVAEAVLRRWMMDEGTLEYDLDAGFNLQQLLNEDLTASDLRRYESRAAIEAEKDERVRSADVTLTLDQTTFRLTVRAQLTLVDDREFTFTAAITQVSAEFLTA